MEHEIHFMKFRIDVRRGSIPSIIFIITWTVVFAFKTLKEMNK